MDHAPLAARRATLAEVAERSQVSLKTASRALGGERYVSEPTRQRVLAAARELGYQRNAAASMLAAGRFADALGFVAGDLANPFYSMVAAGLEDGIRERDMHLSVAGTHETIDHEWLLAQRFADVRSTAIVVASAMPEHSRYQELQNRSIPVVFVDRPAVGIDADSVVFDNREGGRIAARHLLDHGHRRIGFIGDYDWLPTHRERVAGMGEAMDGAQVPDWQRLVRTGAHDARSARQCALELLALPEPPTAIIAGNNRITLGVSEALAPARPGEANVALVGFDDFDWAAVLGVTVIAHDPVEMGREAARLALGRLADSDRRSETVSLPLRLIARGSGEVAPPPPAL